MDPVAFFYFDGELNTAENCFESFQQTLSGLRIANTNIVPVSLMEQLLKVPDIQLTNLVVENWKQRSKYGVFDHLDHEDVFQGYLVLRRRDSGNYTTGSE